MSTNSVCYGGISVTYSIVGFCPKEKAWGVAVQSKFLGVGSIVPWAKAGVGAIATQSYANTSYGPDGLTYLEEGKSAQDVMQALTEPDEQRESRQVGIVDSQGNTATFTGKECYDWAGGLTGEHFAAQGNILVSAATVQALANTFANTKGSLADRLLAALESGQEAGGDKRGMQSASLLVVKEQGGYGGFNDRYIDLRVEDHEQPIEELKRLVTLHALYFQKTLQEDIASIEGVVEDDLRNELIRLDYLATSATSTNKVTDAFKTYLHAENFEMREQQTGYIDLAVLRYMKQQNV